MATLLNSGCPVTFSHDRSHHRVYGAKAELEVGWPMVMPRCTYDSYWLRRRCAPDFIFDLGLFIDNELVGIVEITNTCPLRPGKIKEVLMRGIWLAEVSVDTVERLRIDDRQPGLIQVPCSRLRLPQDGQ
jgi:hypothetical protein